MDLRNIMNNDAGSATKLQPSPIQQSPSRQISDIPSAARPSELSTPSPTYASNPFARPQPPPLPPHQHSPGAASTYSSSRSPFQYNLNLPLNGATAASSPYVQTPPPPSYHIRDSHPGSTPASPAIFTQPAGPLPYTPQASTPHAQQQNPQQQSSSYFTQHHGSQPSNPGPSSQASFAYPTQLSESPHMVTAPRPPLQAQQQQISPPPPQRSQPGTPLGPPVGPFPRPSSQSARPPSAGDINPAHAANSWSIHESHVSEQRPVYPQQTPQSVAPSKDLKQAERISQSRNSSEFDRERSVSVSPKTIVSRQSLSQDRDPISLHRAGTEDERWRHSPSGSHSQNSSVAEHKHPQYTSQQDYPQRSQLMQITSSSPIVKHTPSREPSAAHIPFIKSEESYEMSGRPPKRKKMRYTEPPVYAQRKPGSYGKGPVSPNPRPPIPKHSPARLAIHSRATSVQRSVASPTRSVQTPARPHPVNGVVSTNNRPVPLLHQPEPTYGPLGPWEPSISGKIPHEEMTKVICDFLFKEVVCRREFAAGSAEAALNGLGAVIEIEAKLGQIMDKDRGHRLRLPIGTECILQTENSGFRTAFESSMSLVSPVTNAIRIVNTNKSCQAQHRAMNNFLNEAVKASMPQAGANRIPLSYAHKRERDTFYEVSPQQLPPIIQNYLNVRHKPKVRVTTDQKTGEIIAKIVKCRLADLDVYSPRTCVDWRISVNVEMNYDGDVSNFPIADGGSRRSGGERIKDRMSYRHLAYQIDLTQVGTADVS